MKKILSIFLVVSIFAGCREEPPFINYETGSKLLDSSYVESPVSVPEAKRVLLEDVSGVRCVNCPDAAIIANSIMNAFPGRAFTVVLHPNVASLSSFVDPINKEGYLSKYDFRTDDAKAILENLIGTPGSLPRGAVDRRLFHSGAINRLLGREEWYARAEEQIGTSTPVNLEMKNEFNESTGEGVVTVTIRYTQNVDEDHFLTISLIEDSLIDVQEYWDEAARQVKFNPNYVHMHVLRDVITSPTGDAVSTPATPLVAGRVFVKQYAYKMNVSEKIKVTPKNAKLMALVHKDAANVDVVQVNEIHVTDH